MFSFMFDYDISSFCCMREANTVLMETKTILFGETGLDELVQWLKSTGEPQDIRNVLHHYLEILQDYQPDTVSSDEEQEGGSQEART